MPRILDVSMVLLLVFSLYLTGGCTEFIAPILHLNLGIQSRAGLTRDGASPEWRVITECSWRATSSGVKILSRQAAHSMGRRVSASSSPQSGTHSPSLITV